MTRFDASDRTGREALLADAIAAHRERASPHLTVEADTPPPGGEHPAWVQYRLEDGVLNADYTDEELDRLPDLVASYPEFTIAAREQPEFADGTNVHIEGYTDDDRLATFVEDLFREVYGYGTAYRLWITEI